MARWLAFLFAATLGGAAVAQTPRQADAVGPVVAQTGADFGRSVAFDGEHALIGAPGIGEAFLYELQDGRLVEIAAIAPPLPASESARFGASTALHGDRVLIGAPGLPSSDGGAFLYSIEGNLVVREAVLRPPTPFIVDGFGSAVALSDGVAMVGAAGSEGSPGVVFVYGRDAGGDWTFRRTLSRAAPQAGDGFGSSIALDGGRAVIGAPMASEAEAFIRESGEWMSLGALQGDGVGEFGYACSMSGDLLVVGARGGGFFAGKAFVFSWQAGEWILETPLASAFGGPEEFFGEAVAVSEDGVVAVGSPGDRNRMGSVLIFRRLQGLWRLVTTISHLDARPNDRMGGSVAISDNALLIGVPRDRGNELICIDRLPPCRVGSARLYRICLETLAGDVNGDGDIDLVDVGTVLVDFGSAGTGLLADLNGDGYVGFDDLMLTLSQFGETCFD